MRREDLMTQRAALSLAAQSQMVAVGSGRPLGQVRWGRPAFKVRGCRGHLHLGAKSQATCQRALISSARGPVCAPARLSSHVAIAQKVGSCIFLLHLSVDLNRWLEHKAHKLRFSCLLSLMICLTKKTCWLP